MKKLRKILLILPLVIITCACQSKDVSDVVATDCKNATSASEKFYNFEYSFNQVSDDLKSSIESCNKNATTSDEKSACNEISSLLNLINDYENGNSDNRDNINTKIKEVKKVCGI